MSDLKQTNALTYHYGEVSTPYAQMQQQWDFVIGRRVNQAAFWRYLTLVFLLCSVLLSVVFIWMDSVSPPAVLVAQVSSKGYLVRVGQLTQTTELPITVKKQFIRQYLSAMLVDKSNKDSIITHIPHSISQKLIALRADMTKGSLPTMWQIKPLTGQWFEVKLPLKSGEKYIKLHLSQSNVVSQERLMRNPFGFTIDRMALTTEDINGKAKKS